MNQPAKLKLIITDAAQFFLNNLTQIAALCLPWLLAAALVEYIIVAAGQGSDDVRPLFLVAWTFNLLIYPIYTGALILLMAKRAQREQPVNRELTLSALRTWQPLFMVHVMASGMTALGLMLLVLPGIYIAVRLSFAEFFLVLEGAKPIEALQKSFLAIFRSPAHPAGAFYDPAGIAHIRAGRGDSTAQRRAGDQYYPEHLARIFGTFRGYC